MRYKDELLLWYGMVAWIIFMAIVLTLSIRQTRQLPRCAVVQVNASWNHQNRVKIEKLSKLCYVAEIDIEDKVIGATIAKEWNITIVPTIIVLENGKEVKRFVPGISMRFNEDSIIEDVKKEVRQ